MEAEVKKETILYKKYLFYKDYNHEFIESFKEEGISVEDFGVPMELRKMYEDGYIKCVREEREDSCIRYNYIINVVTNLF